MPPSSVWQKETPWASGSVWGTSIRNPYNSRAGSVWNEWLTDDGDEDGWWGAFKQYTDVQNASRPTWEQFANAANIYDTNAYSFVRDPYDPDWGRNVRPYTPLGATSSETIQHYLDEYVRGSKTHNIGELGGTVGANSTATGVEGWEGVDAWNNAIINAQSTIFQKLGVFVPGNLIKAIMKLESNGQNLPINSSLAVGPMQVTTNNWGNLGYDLFDPEENIMAGVHVLALNFQQGAPGTGEQSWEWAARRYIGLIGADTHGTTQHTYWNVVKNNWDTLNRAVMYGPGQDGSLPQGVDASGLIEAAKQYVGVPYVWGGIPGQGVDPWQFGGWDCSGFIYWLDQNYGTRTMVMGSHHQYADAQADGRLFMDTSELRAGDVVYFDTGLSGGSGANLNRASHVGLYIGGGQIMHAANPSVGTIISDFNEYRGRFIGAEHPAWAGNGGMGDAFAAITKGNPFPITQEYGITEWSNGAGKWMYDYSRSLGWPDGNAHPGLDLGTPEGTNLYAPVAGVVEYAGPGQGFTYNFHADLPNSGGLFIRLTNGDVLILGHMRQIDVKAGDTIAAGQFVGLSGAANGAHVHVEYRKSDGSGGFRSVDPRLALNGVFSGTYSNAGVYTDTERVTSSDNWLHFMKAVATGAPISGYSSMGPDSYHNFLARGVKQGWDFAGQQGVPGSNTIAYTWGVQFGQPGSWTKLNDDVANGDAMQGD